MENTTDYFGLYRTEETIEKIRCYGLTRIVNLDGGYGEEYVRMMDKMKGSGDFVIHFGQVDLSGFESRDFEKEVYRTIKTHAENGVKGLKFWKTLVLTCGILCGKSCPGRKMAGPLSDLLGIFGDL